MIERAELLLDAGDGARAVARHYLKQASEGSERLASDDTDAEALHDFRVAVRRLRSWIRAFAEELDDVRKSDRRALKQLAHATNPGRDAQVQLEWIADVMRTGGAAERVAARSVHDAFDERWRQYEGDVARLVEKKWAKVERALRKRLESDASEEANVTLAQAIAARVPQDAEEMWLALTDVRSVTDATEAHAARIAAKRLRYLIEPAAPHLPSGETLRESLKSLQDDLGTLHDLHVLAGEIFDSAPLVGRLRRDVEGTFERVRARWLDRPMILDGELAAFVEELEGA